MGLSPYICEGYLFVYDPGMEHPQEVVGSFFYNGECVNVIVTKAKDLNQLREITSEDSKEIDKIKKDGKVNKDNLSYIFDIYENIDLLEYNEQMIDFRSQLKEDGVIDYQSPELFKGQLRPYQKRGYIWLHKLKDSKLGGLLADDMGLGKTIQVIALMASLKADKKLAPALIAAPKSLLENWQHEIAKFSPEIDKVYLHIGSSRNKKAEIIKQSEVVLTTYSTLISDQVLLGEIDWRLLVCDEVQAIRNQSTLKAHAVKAQKAKLRLGYPVHLVKIR